MNFQDNLSTMPDISHLSGFDVLDAQGKVLHHIPAVQGKLGSLKLYNALAQEFDNRLDSAAAERGLSLFAEHTADIHSCPKRPKDAEHDDVELVQVDRRMGLAVVQNDEVQHGSGGKR